MFTDVFRYELTQMMIDVYEPRTQRQSFGSWEVSTRLGSSDDDNTMTDLQFQVYENGSNYVIALAGTVFSDIGDLTADAAVLFRTFSEQFEESLSLIDLFIQQQGIDPANITFTGHSLGGAHAQILAETFGSQAFTYDSPGVQGLLDYEGDGSLFFPSIDIKPH